MHVHLVMKAYGEECVDFELVPDPWQPEKKASCT